MMLQSQKRRPDTSLHRRLKRSDRTYIAGYTRFAPGQNVNYLANDTREEKAVTFSGLGRLIGVDLAIQIHEAGNVISAHYGSLKPSEKYEEDDADSGMRLEECVYGKLK